PGGLREAVDRGGVDPCVPGAPRAAAVAGAARRVVVVQVAVDVDGGAAAVVRLVSGADLSPRLAVAVDADEVGLLTALGVVVVGAPLVGSLPVLHVGHGDGGEVLVPPLRDVLEDDRGVGVAGVDGLAARGDELARGWRVVHEYGPPVERDRHGGGPLVAD